MTIGVETQARLVRLATGYRISQLLYVAAELGIADLLASGDKNAEELAQLCHAHAPSLYRAIRTLASARVFAEDNDRRFSMMTPLAEPLRSDVTGSVQGYVIMQLALFSVLTGEPAFNRLHCTDIFAFLEQNPAAADVAIAAVYDFSGALKRIAAAGLAERCPVLGGDFFESVPGGADCYVATITRSLF